MSVQFNCEHVRQDFSAYLDGAMTGHERLAIAAHLEGCADCGVEFNELSSLQQTLASLGTLKAPAGLQASLRTALAAERERGSHLPWHSRLAAVWDRSLAPLAGRLVAGTAATLLLVGGLIATTMSAPAAVEANDEPLGAVTAPHYLYSEIPPQPIDFGAQAPVLVEAKVGGDGRVYDYTIVSGPADPGIERRVQEDLLSSVFRPAMAFGVPVAGRVVITYSGISVRG